jgi:Viral BACON domain
MKPLDEMLPEERDPQYADLIILLQQANHSPILVDSTQRAQVLSRARARLMQTDLGASLTEDMPVPEMRGLASPPSLSEARASKQHRGGQLVRQLNVLAAALVITVLLGTALLIFGLWSPLQVNRNRSGTAPFTGGQQKLTILATQASIGQTPELKLSGFTPKTSVRLTHDGEKLVQTTTGASLVTIGQDSTALVEIFVDRSFLIGLHEIEAHDTTTHVIAITTLRVVGANPTRLPKLVLGVTSLDMGAGRQRTKAVRSFLLENVGGGSIAWSVGEIGPIAGPIPGKVSSLPSWLVVSPPSGRFSQSETITVTVDRGTHPPAFYLLGMTFLPQGEAPINAQLDHLSVRMTMVILSQPAPIMVVSPLNLTFNVMQGQSSPPTQVVSITNTGEGKLYWNMDWIMDSAITNRSWLSASPTRGVVFPGQTEQLTIRMNTHGVNPGVHGGYIDFWEVDSHGNGVGGNYQINLGLIVIKGAP